MIKLQSRMDSGIITGSFLFYIFDRGHAKITWSFMKGVDILW